MSDADKSIPVDMNLPLGELVEFRRGYARAEADIVKWLRDDTNFGDWYGSYAHQSLADKLEIGEHREGKDTQ